LIDFRYHLVSIVAVFLALAIGIVIGAEGLPPQIASQLSSEAQSAVKANARLSAQNDLLRHQVAADNAFAQAVSGEVLSHLLDGEQVVMVIAPGADPATVGGIASALQRAGATVTGEVGLTAQLLAAHGAGERALASLAASLTPPGARLPGPAPAGAIAGQEAIARLLAAALVTRDGLAALSPAQSQGVIGGLGQQGFLRVTAPSGAAVTPAPATLAVIVAPATPPSSGDTTSNATLIALAGYLQAAGRGVVLAGTVAGSGPGSAIDLVTSGGAGVAVTTVDDADTAIGQITVAQALRQLLAPHAAAVAYGVGTGAAPSPAPSGTPSPAPSGTPSPARSGTPRRPAG